MEDKVTQMLYDEYVNYLDSQGYDASDTMLYKAFLGEWLKGYAPALMALHSKKES